MAKTLLLEIVTPDRLVLRQEVESVNGPGVAGDFTILPLHVPFFSSLRVGPLNYRLDGESHAAFVGGGFADVTGRRVLVLAEAAELSWEIDVDRARLARDRAKARLVAARQENVDYTRAASALQRAVLRLKLSELAGRGLPARRSETHP